MNTCRKLNSCSLNFRHYQYTLFRGTKVGHIWDIFGTFLVPFWYKSGTFLVQKRYAKDKQALVAQGIHAFYAKNYIFQ